MAIHILPEQHTMTDEERAFNALPREQRLRVARLVADTGCTVVLALAVVRASAEEVQTC